jgi:hypothetical protein
MFDYITYIGSNSRNNEYFHYVNIVRVELVLARYGSYYFGGQTNRWFKQFPI